MTAKPQPSPTSAPREAPTDAEDEQFLASYDPDAFAHPSLAVDVVILTIRDRTLRVLLKPRAQPPQRGRWALPGGFVGLDESLDAAARRVLRRAGGGGAAIVEQLHTFGARHRDPRHRVVTVAYYALVGADALRGIDLLPTVSFPTVDELSVVGPDGAEVRLAFDHHEILSVAVDRIRSRLGEGRIGFELVGERFTLRELQDVHEALLGAPVNKDSFRRKMLASGHLAPTGEYEHAVEHRPGELFRVASGSIG